MNCETLFAGAATGPMTFKAKFSINLLSEVSGKNNKSKEFCSLNSLKYATDGLQNFGIKRKISSYINFIFKIKQC